MKRLIVMRHAKSSWKKAGIADFDRPLNQRGKRDAPRVARTLMAADYLPDRVLSSAACRAKTTTQMVVDAWDFQGSVEFTEQLYEAFLADYCQVLCELPDACRAVLLVGHNPTIEQLVLFLCGQSVRMPTAAVAVIDIAIASWQQLDRQMTGELTDVIRPRELPELE